MKRLFLILILLSGCGINPNIEDAPPEGYKEIRCTYIDGKGRYGTFTQYVKGEGQIAKLTTYGDIPDNATITCKKDGVAIQIGDANE